MRLRPTVFVNILLCSFTCVCNGAPPREVGRKINFGVKYTTEEDQFIVDELLKVLDGKISLYSHGLWEALSEKHNEEYKKRNPAFPHERTASSLLNRFANVLIRNYPRTEVKVPQDLMQKITKRPTKPETALKHHWNKEENDLIIAELSKLTNTTTTLFSTSTIETLRAEHDKKRLANTPGFEKVRTMDTILSHLRDMKENCQLPPEILEKYTKRTKVSRAPYNIDEDNFITEELSKPSYTGKGLYSSAAMEALRSEHDKKRLAKVPGFETVRTTNSLRKHMLVLKNNGKFPDEILKNLQTDQLVASSSSSTPPNQETNLQVTNEGLNEDEIADMIEELLNNTDYQLDFSKLDSTDYE